MQRVSSLAVCRELGGLAACTPGVCARRKSSTCGGGGGTQQAGRRGHSAGVCASPARPSAPGRGLWGRGLWGRGLCGRRVAFAGQRHRLFCSRAGEEGRRNSARPDISVVGVPDPLTWVRCKVVMLLIKLYFELDLESVEFERGAKQALVHVSHLMSTGRYHRLKGVVSDEMMEYVETRCRTLTKAQRQRLAVTTDDILFLLPEDVSVVFDKYGQKFCFVVMRFWFLTTFEGPEDPEGTKIFKISPGKDGSPQKKIATAVYEFHRELTRGASPDWNITTVWHWHWTPAKGAD